MDILITESSGYSEEALRILRSAGHRVDVMECDRSSLIDVIAKYNAIIVRLGIAIDEELLAYAKKLRVIATLTTGVDHIDVEYASRNDIEIISLKGEREFLDGITPTAELVYAHILTLFRNLHTARDSVLHGIWDRDLFIGESLRGSTIGIVGLGRLGMMAARIGDGFGARICYYDPYVYEDRFAKVGSLAELAEVSDVITIHVHLDEQTKGMIGSDFFRLCKNTVIVINTSRAGIMREGDLLHALEAGDIAGAGLDVLEGEIGQKTIRHALIDYARHHENLIITPHIGGAARDAMRMVEKFIAEKLIVLETARASK